MQRPTLMTRLDAEVKTVKENIKAALSKASYVATTTDCWSARRRSFIGVTVHWINGDSLERESAALACRRLKGSHIFGVLASALVQLHIEYGIEDTVVRTTTDSGSNFIKAFVAFGAPAAAVAANAEEPQTGVTDVSYDQTGDDNDDEHEIQCDVIYHDSAELLDKQSNDQYHLPRHQRYACHILNFVATVDSLQAERDASYKQLYRAALVKLPALWNKTGRSWSAADTVTDECDLQFILPNQTRWNSTFMAVARIVRIANEKGESSLRNVCTSFQLKP